MTSTESQRDNGAFSD